MKKFLALLLSMLMIFSLISLAGCGEKAGKLKFGMGVEAVLGKVTDADGENNGIGETSTTVAAVLLNEDGKILDCAIDAMDNKVTFTSAGKAVTAQIFKSKYEMGNDYGMKEYSDAKKEWYEQVDAFTALVKGKTIDEVKALVGKDSKGNDDVVKAGCTIAISDFVLAVSKAVENAADCTAAKEDDINIGIFAAQNEAKDATDDAEGKNGFDVSISACALDKNGKITAAKSDVLSVSFGFNTKGMVSTAADTKFATKRQSGDNYGMAQHGNDLNGDGKVEEWYKQADAFDNACIGKTADSLTALVADNGYGDAELLKAGCTINISDMVKAAVKAANR